MTYVVSINLWDRTKIIQGIEDSAGVTKITRLSIFMLHAPILDVANINALETVLPFTDRYSDLPYSLACE